MLHMLAAAVKPAGGVFFFFSSASQKNVENPSSQLVTLDCVLAARPCCSSLSPLPANSLEQLVLVVIVVFSKMGGCDARERK